MAAHEASDNSLGFSVDSKVDDNVPLILDSSSVMVSDKASNKLGFSEDCELDDNIPLNLRDTALSIKRDFDDDEESQISFKKSKVAMEESEQGEGGGEEQVVDEEIKSGDQSSPFSDENDELESLENYILFNLQAASDPAKIALDIIQNPIIEMEHKTGDNAVIIDDGNILLLKQLRKISPDIRPHVREEAMKLALDVKAYICQNTENSAAILGFLLLVSIYGLAHSLDEDEVLKLFGFAAQHEMAVELFGILGFADKASDLVKKLIIKEQYIEAERFFRAYLMPAKIEQPISCIQEAEEIKVEGGEGEFEGVEGEGGQEVLEEKEEEKHLEIQVKEVGTKKEHFEVQHKELKSKENRFEGEVKDVDSMPNEFDALLKSFEEEINSDDQSTPTIDGRSLQLLPSDETEILDNLLESSDPAKVVLDIIQNPIIQKYKMGDNAVIIDERDILLLEQLMRISPHIKPCVREEAMKLALNLKSYISETTENSVAVLGFLLLLSIYKLAPSFDEDEILKLFGFAAQHKIAVKLFGILGFADKASDFVQKLIMKKQNIEAARFIRAYIMPTRTKTLHPRKLTSLKSFFNCSGKI